MNASALVLVAAESLAAGSLTPPELAIRRTSGRISVDGQLREDGWKSAQRVETWYETNPGDNTPPTVRNVGYLAYDDKAFYAAFEFHDPDPRSIRAPLGDRDNVPSSTDYGGVILDTRNDGKTGILFLANPRGIQYDAVSSDASGSEDSSPDFFWEAAARIDGEGWVLEIRIPFSSLRYPKTDPATWGIMLYRNYPRAYRYQFFSTTLPRGGNCFICRSNKLAGLVGLPAGSHFVAAPYVSGSRTAEPRGGELGSDLETGPLEGEIGFDLKWTPSANTAVDAAVNPDFSQIESDVAQITSNERFALFFPEKRPFFLEGVDLLATPVQAVYTRTITAPYWGARATGKLGATAYTVLVAQDEGGGSVILPGSNSSEFADQDFRSWVAIGRARRDLGRSFVSVLGTDREIEGGGYNRVFGPDFQWRPTADDNLTGQLLLSRSQTPERPDLAATWDERFLAGHAADVWWNHSTRRVDWFAEYRDFGDEFRADNGFVPQVGYRQTYAEAGYTFRPQGFLRRLRTFAVFNRSAERDGDLLNRQYAVAAGMDGRWNSFFQLFYSWERVRAGDTVLPRRRLRYTIEASPSRFFNYIYLFGYVGDEVDFTGARAGTGLTLSLQATMRPTDHLELRANIDRRWLDLPAAQGAKARLFTARVDRLRATYTFTSRMFVRLVGQYVETRRDPTLYPEEVTPRDADFAASALFAYKLNWQTVLFVGYGDERALTDTDSLEPSSRQFFAKVSYAFQR